MTSLPSTKVQADIYVGAPTTLSTKQSRNIHFCNFLSLPSKRGDFTLSPCFECHGYKWRLELYPGGDGESEKGKIGLFLTSLNDEAVYVKYSLNVPKMGNGARSGDATFAPKVANDVDSWGFNNFKTREDIISSCLDDNGTLTIKVSIQVYTDTAGVWKPKQSLKNDILHMFKSGEETDVSFLVDGEIVKAHRFMLKIRAPLLADIVVDSSHSDTDTPIPNVKADIFRTMIEFLYTDECPENLSKNNAKELLVVAKKFGCQRLKLLLEMELVEKYLNVSSSIDLLLLADGNSCALLKESAMKLITSTKNLKTVNGSSDWIRMNKSADLLDEVLSNVAGNQYNSADGQEEDNYSKLSVKDILVNLEEKNLNMDGTREMLLKRLRDDGDDVEKQSTPPATIRRSRRRRRR